MEELKETWKPIAGYEGRYEISDNGRVKSLARTVPNRHGERKIREKILPQRINRCGYYTVVLCKHCISKFKLVHRLIAEAFIPNPENKPFIDHINTVRTDNRIENLRWVSAKEIMQKKLDTLRKNKRVNAPRKVVQYTLDGEYVATYDSYNEAHRKTGVRTRSISEYCRGLRLKAGNYIWRHEGDELGEIIRPQSKKKKVLQFDKKTGAFIKEWNSLEEAAEYCNIYTSSLSRSIRRGTFRGDYIWKYKEK